MKVDKLKGQMREKKQTVESLAEVTGIRYGTLRNKLDGYSRFYVDEAERISKALGIYDQPELVMDIFFS